MATTETKAGDCSVGRAPDPNKGSLLPLYLFLWGQATEGVVCWGFGYETSWPSRSWVPGNQCLRPMVRLWTMSLVGLGGTRASMGMCFAQPWKIVSAELSQTSSKEPFLTIQGPRCRASPLVRSFCRKPGSQTSN